MIASVCRLSHVNAERKVDQGEDGIAKAENGQGFKTPVPEDFCLLMPS
jgi:hypothetical protein